MRNRDHINEEREAKLNVWLRAEIDKAKDASEKMFLGCPDAWYDSGKHLCNSGHIHSMYLKSEALGGAVCMACQQPSHLCPPDMTEEKLKQILEL